MEQLNLNEMEIVDCVAANLNENPDKVPSN